MEKTAKEIAIEKQMNDLLKRANEESRKFKQKVSSNTWVRTSDKQKQLQDKLSKVSWGGYQGPFK